MEYKIIITKELTINAESTTEAKEWVKTNILSKEPFEKGKKIRVELKSIGEKIETR